MQNEYNHLIESLRVKLRKVLTLFEQQKKDKIILIDRNYQLEEELKTRNSEIEILKDKIEKLKIAKTLTGEEGDSHEAKKQITKLVREIDKCIALLNR